MSHSQYSLGFHLGIYSTDFQAETFVICRSCENLFPHNIVNLEILRCIDSEANIKAIESHFFDSAVIKACKPKLNVLGNNNKITILWVPAHQGINGNEKADKLAV